MISNDCRQDHVLQQFLAIQTPHAEEGTYRECESHAPILKDLDLFVFPSPPESVRDTVNLALRWTGAHSGDGSSSLALCANRE